MNGLIILDILIRGAGISACLFFCALILRQGLKEQTVWRGILYGIGVASYFICSAPWYEDLPLAVRAITLVFCVYNPLLFWLVVRALFEDALSFSRLESVVTLLYSALAIAFFISTGLGAEKAINVTSILCQVAGFSVVLHSISETVRQYGNDLLNPRRRLRVYMLGLFGGYLIAVLVAQFVLQGAQPPLWVSTLSAFSIAVLAIANNYASVNFRWELLPPHVANSAGQPDAPIKRRLPAVDGVEATLVQKVIDAMEKDKIYREEKLSIPAMARTLGTQEYLLRRAINRGLGQRNFSRFLNSYRLSEVKLALTDPEKSHLPILTIAYDAGFNSMGPFNRAFKETFAVTPSEFRQAQRNEQQ